ncbi:MAG: 16S rRNA (adenine(1518)-N(6)/adenine(1519)-N(6))-dimethyltransferase RsmA [Pseudomonadota bacterium]
MSALDGLPPLREVIARHGLSARKALGQNFLLDLNLTAKIARASGPLAGAEVVEIGPGPGGLTRALLAEGAAKVTVVELDPRCLDALDEISRHYPGRLTVLEGDAMKIDLAEHVGPEARIVGNLPYNVGTALLTGWLTSKPWPPWWQSLTLLFQKEVAQRITAQPGSKAYGRLSVLAQWRSTARTVFDIPPQAFTPAPKVTSALVHLRPAAQPEGIELKSVEALSSAAFGNRRKMLRQTLKSVDADAAGLLAKAGIEGTRRGETLTLDEFMALARLLEQRRAGSV